MKETPPHERICDDRKSRKQGGQLEEKVEEERERCNINYFPLRERERGGKREGECEKKLSPLLSHALACER